MPSSYLLKSNGETFVIEPVHTVSGAKLTVVGSSATVNYKVDLPPGTYQCAIFVDSNVTGTTTAIDDVVPYVDEAQTKVTPAAANEFSILSPGDATTNDKTFALPTGDSGSYVVIAPNSGTACPRELPLLRGFQFTITKGTAVAGEKLIARVIATSICRF